MPVNKYNLQQDLTDHFQEQNQRLKSLERTVSSGAMSRTFMMDTEPWPAEGPSGDHVSSIGVIWFNTADNTVWRWSEAGEWAPITPVSAPMPRSFWYLSATFSVGGTGANTDINTWVDDTINGQTNHPDISMDSGQNVNVVRGGLYRITAGLTYPVNATGRRYMQIFTGTSGGAVIAGDWRGTSSTGVVTPQVSRTTRLNANDIFRVTAAQDSGSSLSLLSGNQFSYLQVEYVAP